MAQQWIGRLTTSFAAPWRTTASNMIKSDGLCPMPQHPVHRQNGGNSPSDTCLKLWASDSYVFTKGNATTMWQVDSFFRQVCTAYSRTALHDGKMTSVSLAPICSFQSFVITALCPNFVKVVITPPVLHCLHLCQCLPFCCGMPGNTLALLSDTAWTCGSCRPPNIGVRHQTSCTVIQHNLPVDCYLSAATHKQWLPKGENGRVKRFQTDIKRNALLF